MSDNAWSRKFHATSETGQFSQTTKHIVLDEEIAIAIRTGFPSRHIRLTSRQGQSFDWLNFVSQDRPILVYSPSDEFIPLACFKIH